MDEEKLYQRIDLGFLKTERREADERKISEAVFDKASIMSLYELVKKGAITELRSIVSTGKEASLFLGKKGKKDVAVKIFLMETTDFRNMTKYVTGDPRFGSWKNRRQLVHMWAQKEFKNLSRVQEAIRCPKPMAVEANILVMGFLGEGGKPAPRLKDTQLKDPQKYFDETVGYIRQMYKLRIVHADLSEYNILDYKGHPYIIDMATGVLLDHPSSMEFLQRDVRNVVNFFKKQGADADYDAVMKSVLSEELKEKSEYNSIMREIAHDR
ncbi:MAG: serine protein kinase RIO [Candidatus Altiarchaeota archaeon]